MQKIWSTLISGAVGGLVVFAALQFSEKSSRSAENAAPAYTRQVNYGNTPLAFDFTKAAEKSMDAVVHIKATESRESAASRQRNQRNVDPFEFFFGQRFDYQQQPRSGTGSGVIYTDDGYILTNNHVVEFADEFIVTMHDSREFKARMVGRDPDTDMAVIKIDASNLPAIELGNSDDVKVGEWALAVGNPFDLTSTVTAGIISAKGRNINIIKGKGINGIESFIQTDAAVNPGNSGGALVDVTGRLIGINSAIATPTGVFAGYSFAIPINLVKRIADDLIKYGEFRRAYLGANIRTMDANVAKQLNIDFIQGALMLELDPEGSAARSGMVENDIVIKINGKTVTSTSELLELIGRSKVGETVTVTVVRNNKTQELPVRLQSKPAEN